jgi:ubiquinone/menaquinone biosynthesis C-methylase UbiE
MKKITHEEQKRIWEEEHAKPTVLLQMDSESASSGVERFHDWLTTHGLSTGKGIEFGCGKGRNVIWLAKQGFTMTGIDFSPSAIDEAKKRTIRADVQDSAEFIEHDVTESWPFPDTHFDFVIDCFAMTDIESLERRQATAKEALRVLKSGGFVFVYALSTDDEFHKGMIKTSPTDEKNAFTHPSTGKFEKSFDRQELIDLWKELKLVEEDRIKKVATFFSKQYSCKHFWMVFEKK